MASLWHAAMTLAIVVAVLLPPSRGEPTASVFTIASLDGSTVVTVDGVQGIISSLQQGPSGPRRSVVGQTWLSGCTALGSPQVSRLADGSVQVSRTLDCAAATACSTIFVTDNFSPANSSVTWVASIGILAPMTAAPFSTSIWTSMTLATPQNATYWTTWGKGCVQNQATTSGMCFSQGLLRHGHV